MDICYVRRLEFGNIDHLLKITIYHMTWLLSGSNDFSTH